MAGLGFKDFQVGEVLTSTAVDGYLMQQSVMRFADSAARGSALGTAVGTAVPLAEGMVSYLDDSDRIEVYDGSNWRSVGSILQVVEASYSTLVTITLGTYTDTGLSASITPTLSTSKILAICSMAAEIDAGSASSYDCQAAITRGSTQIREFRVTAASFGGSLASTHVTTVLDSPATTSAVTYKAQARLVATGSSRSWRAQDNSATSTMTLLEVAG